MSLVMGIVGSVGMKRDEWKPILVIYGACLFFASLWLFIWGN